MDELKSDCRHPRYLCLPVTGIFSGSLQHTMYVVTSHRATNQIAADAGEMSQTCPPKGRDAPRIFHKPIEPHFAPDQPAGGPIERSIAARMGPTRRAVGQIRARETAIWSLGPITDCVCLGVIRVVDGIVQFHRSSS